MGRQSKKCPKKCLKHHFSLKPVHYSAFFSRESEFSYCPPNLQTQPHIPKFNRDGKPYTASFILATDQLKLQNNDEVYKIEHERFKRQHSEQKTQIFVPKPRGKNSYCSVCKDLYDDYQEHIMAEKHKLSIKNSAFNSDVLELCQKFENNVIKSIKSIFFEDFTTLDTSKTPNQTFFSYENQKQKNLQFDFEEPELFGQKSTRENLEGLNNCKTMKSFHSYIENKEAKVDNYFQCPGQNYFLQHSLFKQFNENFLPQFGSFKNVECTASPIKTRYERPIVLTSTVLKLDE